MQIKVRCGVGGVGCLDGSTGTAVGCPFRGPGCVKTRSIGECAELSSLFSSFDGDSQSGFFVIQRNGDKLSTRKFDVGVFTQAGSSTDLTAPKFDFRSSPESG